MDLKHNVTSQTKSISINLGPQERTIKLLLYKKRSPRRKLL